jgi:predicted transcriptional regulator
MHDESTCLAPDPDERAEKTILSLLLIADSQRPWSVDEVAREMGDRVRAADGIASLHAAGLVHRCGEFVFATRAALYMDQLSQ